MDLDAIEQRTRAATEGPWEYDGRTLWGRDDIGRIKADTPEDRAFTAAARTDVPALVARVRELEEALASVRELIDGHRLGTDRLIPGTELEAALERARENGGGK